MSGVTWSPIIRDLTELSINMVKTSRLEAVQQKAEQQGEERLLDLLLPPPLVPDGILGRLGRGESFGGS